jgi:hypothetical protein
MLMTTGMTFITQSHLKKLTQRLRSDSSDYYRISVKFHRFKFMKMLSAVQSEYEMFLSFLKILEWK